MLNIVQGNCGPTTNISDVWSSDSSVSLRPLLPGQCLILADQNVIALKDNKIWIDGLYIRLTVPRNSTGYDRFVDVSGSDSQVWMTNVTLQGSGNVLPEQDCNACGLAVSSSGSVYAEGTWTPLDAIAPRVKRIPAHVDTCNLRISRTSPT